jgi:hypothetical protein
LLHTEWQMRLFSGFIVLPDETIFKYNGSHATHLSVLGHQKTHMLTDQEVILYQRSKHGAVLERTDRVIFLWSIWHRYCLLINAAGQQCYF